ncbi:hypothetical protein KCV87_00775 [Actinosynnema pretiosum subsp. pretiosum]|uniref:Uncharacterized protein n=1 Tax=Actinosynnema pretiosum subsp. pretiosum TaxID=103721 RepID=A0AA45R4A4_9PSEU|nr:hypothetical protein KCV87_00775 [Actinosynnema pretiosum subsp. pretiosum]
MPDRAAFQQLPPARRPSGVATAAAGTPSPRRACTCFHHDRGTANAGP